MADITLTITVSDALVLPMAEGLDLFQALDKVVTLQFGTVRITELTANGKSSGIKSASVKMAADKVVITEVVEPPP